MKLSVFFSGLTLLLVLTAGQCLAVEGYKQTYHLLLIDAQAQEPYTTFRKELYAALAARGYKEGQNLQITYYTLGNFEGRAQNIWRIVEKHKKYDAICISGTITGIAFKKIAEESPGFEFIFGCITDPVGLGLIDNFSTPPKGSFTGVAYPVKPQARFRFLKKVLPQARKIGLVSADMPQSQSYTGWLKKLLTEKEFEDFHVSFRTIPFVKSDAGPIRMSMLAKKHIIELDSSVDVFLAPHDQMGISKEFPSMVYQTATKPLIGVGREDVMKKWGATMTITPALKDQAQEVAGMIDKVFRGESVKNILPLWLDAYEIAFDLEKIKHFGINIPQELLDKAGENIVH